MQSKNKKIGLAIIIAAFVAMLAIMTPVVTYAKTGWSQDGSGWHYYVNDVKKTGWLKDGSKWYYLDSAGTMVTGWREINYCWYYFNPSGAMQTGWKYMDGSWYYFGGADDGVSKAGWRKISGYWYYFKGDGRMATGWITDGGKKYFLNNDGDMVTGWKKINGTWYYFSSSGAMQTGWLKNGGKWYYLNSDGKMAIGWITSGNARYYLSSSGAMVTGWQYIGGKWYYFNSSGAMQTGWIKPGSVWYFLSSDGSMVTGWQTIGGVQYYFNSDGAMQTGTVTIGGKTYTFASSGALIGGVSSESVSTYNNTTGYTLRGTVYKPTSGNGKTVIICHGLGADSSQAAPIAKHLAQNGYTVFAFDFAGGGPGSTSGGSMTNMSVLTELKDLEYIYNYVSSQSYVNSSKIFIAAHSQGAIVAGLYAAQHPQNVKGLVFYAPGFVVANDWAPKNAASIPTGNVWMWDNVTVGPKYFQDLWSLLGGSRTKIYSLMSPYSGPVLMLHGTSDATTSISYTRTMKSHYSNATLKEYSGADHVFSGSSNHDKLLNDTLNFLNSH